VLEATCCAHGSEMEIVTEIEALRRIFLHLWRDRGGSRIAKVARFSAFPYPIRDLSGRD
jgi:hypothetical protein